MLFMLVTAPTSQLLRSAAKLSAFPNMAFMLVTAPTSQLLRSASKSRWAFPWGYVYPNSPSMSVTPDTSQSAMLPYADSAAVGSPIHAPTAV